MPVWADKRVRWPVSRVLYRHGQSRTADDHSSRVRVATHLARPTRTAIRKPICAVPIWSCSRWGLPCPPRYRSGGALLPHPFTLTGRTGGLLSVALSLGSPPPGITRHRVSVEPGLSSPHFGQRSSGHLTDQKCRFDRQSSTISKSVPNNDCVSASANPSTFCGRKCL